jgi:POT family proton-dependent oligopeptide transporter
MAIGHFLMAFEASFLVALAALLVGVGCFKGNIAAQVGDLCARRQAPGERLPDLRAGGADRGDRRAHRLQHARREEVAWHWGFGAAGVGMVIGLVVYLSGRRWLPPEPGLGAAAKKAGGPRPAMTGAEKARLALLIALIPVLMLSIVGNQQFANAYPLWAQKHMDFGLFGWEVPVTWLQAVDAAVSTVTMLGSIAFWRWWATRRREPDELVKMGLGALLATGGRPCRHRLDPGRDHGREGGLGWTLGYTLVNDLGFANILPVGWRSTRAPRRGG